MNKITNDLLKETVYVKKLENGLNVYLCKKPGFKNNIGLFGTKYGSVDNEFIDILTNDTISVPDGVAHFLEHKLFEQEDSNALDLFSKIGVSANAYTSFDQTVYYFETVNKLNEGLELLIKLVSTPYFTDENVEKEKGIIAQEIKMYEDSADYVAYFNTLSAMYKKNPVRIDIAGTVESISNIDKETLYKCYNNFYNLNNMFLIVVGDMNIDEVIEKIETSIKKQNITISPNKEVVKLRKEEPETINTKKVEHEMEVYMPQVCVGYKAPVMNSKDALKTRIIGNIINEMYFSKLSSFFNNMYTQGILNEPLYFDYENGPSYSHFMISGATQKLEELEKELFEYIEEIKNDESNKYENDFEIAVKKKIGNTVLESDIVSESYRRIINSIINKYDIYEELDMLNKLKYIEVKEILKLLTSDKRVISIVKNKVK